MVSIDNLGNSVWCRALRRHLTCTTFGACLASRFFSTLKRSANQCRDRGDCSTRLTFRFVLASSSRSSVSQALASRRCSTFSPALDDADEGSVAIDGTALGALEEAARTRLRRERIGFVFQAFHILPYLTLRQNVALPLALVSPDAAAAATRADGDAGSGRASATAVTAMRETYQAANSSGSPSPVRWPTALR